MTIRHSVRVRNAMAEAITSAIDAASQAAPATLQIWSGSPGSEPVSAAAAATGTLLGSATIPSAAYMAAASGGSQSLANAVSGLFTAAGTMRYYRIVAGDGSCDEQGTITLTGGGGDATVSGASLAVVIGQPISLVARSLVGANA